MFGRRRKLAQAGPAVFTQQQGVVTVTPVLAQPPHAPAPAGTAGWRAFPGVLAPHEQIGAYAGSMLNQFPAMLPGVQLHSGREGHNTHYFTPTAQPVYLGGLSQTTRPNNIAGAQRYGSMFGGPIGPITAQQNQAAVYAAQVKQSGLAALGWAKALTPQSPGS